jgi:predicted dehydrogenase
LQRAQSRFPSVAVYSDASDLLANKEVDAVVISTPASTHHQLARKALQAGRDVIVEKPLALELEQCEELVELSAKTGRVLMVAHTFLYNPGVRKLREYVGSAEFGRVYYLHATRTNLGPIRQDVSAIWDLAPHDISIFNYLLGKEPIWASAVGAQSLGNSREDVGFITLGYPDNVIGNIHVSWADPNKVRRVVVVGSQQRLVFDDLSDLERVRVYKKGVSATEADVGSFGEFKLLVRDGDILSPKIEYSEPLKNQAQDFVTAIAEGRQPFSDGVTGARVVEALIAIDASIRQRGKTVEVRKCTIASRSA